MKTKISITIDKKLIEDVDSMIDNITIRNRSQAIENLVNNALGENRNAVILCGGDEKRLEISPNHYSPTLKINNLTLIESTVRKLMENHFKNIFIIARSKILTNIFEILKDGSLYGVKVHYIEEKTSNGTASSLRLLRGKISSNFLVVYGDLYFNKINIDDLWKEHLKRGLICTLMLTTSSEPSKKGTVVMEGNRILRFTQKPAKSDVYLVFSPIFATSPNLLEYPGKSLEYDVFPQLAEKNLLNGYFSSKKEIHIHNLNDSKKINKKSQQSRAQRYSI